MFTSSTATTSRRSTTKRRPPLFAGGAVLLAVGLTAGSVVYQGGQGSHISRVAPPAVARRTAGGNLRQAATRGGVADLRQFQPADATAANALQPIPRGGYAEWLDAQRAATTGSSLQPIPRGGFAELPRDHPAIATAAASQPMGGYAEWLLWRSEAAQAAAQ